MSIVSDVDQDGAKKLRDSFNRPTPPELLLPTDLLLMVLREVELYFKRLKNYQEQHNLPGARVQVLEIREQIDKLEGKKALKLVKNLEPGEISKKLNSHIEKANEVSELVTAELESARREQAVAQALERVIQGKLASAQKIESFVKLRKMVAKQSGAVKRTSQYIALERSIKKQELASQEEQEPGSTWQTQVDYALQEAVPQLPGMPLSHQKKTQQKIQESLKHEAPITSADMEALEQAFRNFAKRKIAEKVESVPSGSEKLFESRALECVERIVNDQLLKGEVPLNDLELGQRLAGANTALLQQLGALKRQYPANPTPNLRVRDGKIVVTKGAPKQESLVLQGGGGKGVGLPPMLEEMHNAGMFDNVSNIVGTSIGALNASCLACGGLEDERQVLNISAVKHGYDAKKFKKQYPDVHFGHPHKAFYKDITHLMPSAAGEMALIDGLTASRVAANVESYSEDDLADEVTQKLNNLDNETLTRIGLDGVSAEGIAIAAKKLAAKIKHQDFESSDRTAQMITFRDLALLHQLDPKNFKELTITAFEGTDGNGKSVYLNAATAGDMPIALAARCSMGLPIVAPIYWNNRGPFYDGGLGTNAPLEAAPGLDTFYADKEYADAEEELKGDVPVEVQDAMAKTMLVTFDSDGQAEDSLHGQRRTTAEPAGAEKATVIKPGINPEYGQTLKNDAQKAYNSGVNAFVVNHGDLGTVALGELVKAGEVFGNKNRTDVAEMIARTKSLEQLDQRTDQAVEFSCTSVDEALTTMSSDEMRRLVAAGVPQGSDPLIQQVYYKCEEFLKIEELSKKAAGGDLGELFAFMKDSALCRDYQSSVEFVYIRHGFAMKSTDRDAVQEDSNALTNTINVAIPPYLRKILKEAVLVPVQKRLRSLPQAEALDFVWDQELSASGFRRSMKSAEQNKVFAYRSSARAVHKALVAYEKLRDEKPSSQPRFVCAAMRKTMAELDRAGAAIRNMLRDQAYAHVAPLNNYATWLQEEIVKQTNEHQKVIQGAGAQFAAQTFEPWDRKDFEAVMHKAVLAGAIENLGTKPFTKQLNKARKAASTAKKANAEAVQVASHKAWMAWDTLTRMAQAFHERTQNTNLRDYFQQCIAATTKARDQFTAP